ncbi:MAG TPA: hypothetical protein ENN73_07160 [Firmicutes bacterium]|nr:hypothetical protein [Bacillota bacterium]
MTFDEFKKEWESLATTEKGAIKMYLIAILEYLNENPDGGRMIGQCVPKGEFSPEGKPTPSHRFYLEQFGKVVKGTDFPGGIAASYLGGTPQNGYKYDYANEIVVIESSSKFGSEESKVFVKSGGKDNPSPVTLKKNKDGFWKLFGVSSLCTGVRPIDNKDF